ncbi:MAG: hypothetical protein AB7S78_04045 [Candidatus Omnitrophota bacterium]
MSGIEKKEEQDILSEFKESVVLMQGVFDPVYFDLVKQNNFKEVFVLEGRPSLESAQYSCTELIKRKIKPTLIADSMAGFLFYKNLVKEVWLSYQQADEKAALCQIGALILGVLGKKHNVPVKIFPNPYKLNLVGNQKEIFYFNGFKVAPSKIKGYVPLAEWVPRKYITEIKS